MSSLGRLLWWQSKSASKVVRPKQLAATLRTPNTILLVKEQMNKAKQDGIFFESAHKRKNGSEFPVEVSSVGTDIGGEKVLCSIVRDISERKKAEEALRESEERYRMLFENAKDLVYTRKVDGKITSVNAACEKTLGYSKEQMLQMNIEQILDKEYHKHIQEPFEKDIYGEPAVVNLEVKFITAENKKIVLELSKSILYKDGNPDEIQVIARDISERRTMEAELKYLSFHDQLTGLYNRTFFERKLEEIKDQWSFPLSIIMADVNGLKLVNDAFGHQEGDQLLKAVSEILKSSANSNSYVIRLGGDEFVILTPYHTEYGTKEMSVKFGQALKMGDEELSQLALLALLHDIGKVIIPKSIFEKPDVLTKEEWDVVKRHCQVGYNIAKAVPELSAIAEFILLHHERWDGEGYPQGLKGTSIPFMSRIITILDAYDVMTHERPYKTVISKEEAILELRKNAGTQFDPVLVETFIDMLAVEK